MYKRQVVTCYDILEATLRRAHLTPYDPEEAAEDGIGCGRCCALCEDPVSYTHLDVYKRQPLPA